MALAAVLVRLHVRDHPALSHIDGLQDMDYTLKSPFHVPRSGDTIGQAAMEEVALLRQELEDQRKGGELADGGGGAEAV